MKLGVIISNYNSAEFIDSFFEGWIAYKKEFSSPEIVFSIIDVKFKENEDENPLNYSNDGGLEKLEKYKENGVIRYLQAPNVKMTEIEARNLALKPLLEEKCEWILTTATDEWFKIEQIRKILDYIQKDPFIAWYSLQYKNFFRDRNHYLLGFNPPRLLQSKYALWRLDSFFEDDGVVYKNALSEEKISFKNLSNKTIPGLTIDHFCWLDGERSIKKILYQERRWSPPNGFGCSFKINNDQKTISFNLDYFNRTNTPLPTIYETN